MSTPTNELPLVLGHPATPGWCEAVDSHHRATEEHSRELAAEVVLLKQKLESFGAVCYNVVPGEHGEGQEVAATPESIKATIAYLQSEWDDAEARLQEMTHSLNDAR